MVLNRADQADREATKDWAAFFKEKGWAVMETDSKSGAGTAKFSAAVRELLDKKPELPLALVKTVFEWRCMCASGYEPQLEGCALCGAPEPEQPRFHPLEGMLHCAACRPAEDSMPLSPAALAALRQIVYGDPKKIFSFRLDGESLKQLGKISERYMLLQLDRGFGTLDFYKQLSI